MAGKDVTDDALLARYRAGDDAAFGALHDRHYSWLLRHATRITRSPQDAEDAVQDALVRAHRSLRADEREVRIGPWLATLVHNTSIDIVRRRHPTPGEVSELVSPGADEVLLRRLALRDVLRRVRDLPDRQRLAVAMRAFEGRSHDEIADALGTTAQSSRALVMRARNSLGQSPSHPARRSRCAR